MSIGSVPPPPQTRRFAPLAWVLNPYFLILAGALLDTTGELFLKRGAEASNSFALSNGPFAFLSPMGSGWTWIGIVSYVLSLLTWLYVLRTVPLSVAFPLINIVHVLVPIGSSVFLHEHVSAGRWLGICLIILGVFAIVRPLVTAEEKL